MLKGIFDILTSYTNTYYITCSVADSISESAHGSDSSLSTSSSDLDSIKNYSYDKEENIINPYSETSSPNNSDSESDCTQPESDLDIDNEQDMYNIRT
jgi:hypothetical protein